MKSIFLVVLFLFCAALSSCRHQQHVIKVEYMAEPCLIPTSSGKWKLCDNMIVHIDNEYHAVPRGFKTDLASIHRSLWWLYSPTDFDSIASSVLHDWNYCCTKEITREQADLVFYYGLRAQGMPNARANLYYYGVRSWGWLFFTGGEGINDHIAEFDKNELQGVYEDVNYQVG